jgi:hypothetical protein
MNSVAPSTKPRMTASKNSSGVMSAAHRITSS